MGGDSVGSKVGQKGGQAKTRKKHANSPVAEYSKKEGGNSKQVQVTTALKFVMTV